MSGGKDGGEAAGAAHPSIGVQRGDTGGAEEWGGGTQWRWGGRVWSGSSTAACTRDVQAAVSAATTGTAAALPFDLRLSMAGATNGAGGNPSSRSATTGTAATLLFALSLSLVT